MAFENIGVGGFLKFDSQEAETNMQSASRGFDGVKSKAQGLKAGLGKAGSALSTVALAAAPISIALGVGATSAIEFEAQMSSVKSVSQASSEEMAALTAQAKKLGIETVFTATQAGSAMEELARAGFKTEDIMKALPGVLSAAAVEGIGLGEAAGIVSNVLRGMNLQTSQAGHVADVLALASAATATSVAGLGESFSYAATTAAQRNITLEETAAIMGLLGNAGVKGSAAGTTFNAMLRQMLEITPRSKEALAQLGYTFFDVHGKMKPLPTIVDEFKHSLGKLKTEQEKLQIVQKIFGDEGARGFNILMNQGGGALKALTEQLRTSSDAVDEHGNKVGQAAIMASQRLDNLAGAAHLLKSSLESFFISVIGPFLKPMADTLRSLTDRLNGLLFAIEMVSTNTDGVHQSFDGAAMATKQFGSTTTQVALGLLDVMGNVKASIEAVKRALLWAGDILKSHVGEDGTRSLVRIIGTALVFLAVLAPIIGTILVLGNVIGALVTVISVVGAAFAALSLGTVAAIAGLLVPAFLMFRREGESVGDTFSRLWVIIKQGAQDLVSFFGPTVAAIVNIWNGLTTLVSSFTTGASGQWSALGESFSGTFANLINGIGSLWTGIIKFVEPVWMWILRIVEGAKPALFAVGTAVGDIFGAIGDVASSIMRLLGAVFSFLGAYVVPLVGFIIKQAVDWLAPGLGFVITAISKFIRVFAALFGMIVDLITAVVRLLTGDFAGAWEIVVSGIKRFANAVFEFMMTPVRLFVEYAALAFRKVANLTGSKAFGDAAKSLEDFANNKITFNQISGKSEESKSATAAAASNALESSAEGQANFTPAPADAKPTVEVKATIDNKTSLSVDGRRLAVAEGRHKTEISERAGFNQTPWQRRRIATDGVAPKPG